MPQDLHSTLRGLRPDVAGLQEVWGGASSSQAELLADRLGMYPAFAAPSLPPKPATPESPDQEGIEVGVAVLSRWPILQVREHRLPSANWEQPVALLTTLDHSTPRPTAPEVRALTDVMVDTWVAGGGDPTGVTLSTRNPFAPREARRQIGQRIDYILARPGTTGQALSIAQAFVADAPVDGLPPSDHYAVIADLAL